MVNFKITKRGFTLIELLMVVAIIATLSAVSLPLFANYRVRGFNTAAVSDLKTFKTMMEASFNDQHVYPTIN